MLAADSCTAQLPSASINLKYLACMHVIKCTACLHPTLAESLIIITCSQEQIKLVPLCTAEVSNCKGWCPLSYRMLRGQVGQVSTAASCPDSPQIFLLWPA